MWTEVYQCRVCKMRYSLEPVCALCQERSFWKDDNNFPWEVLLSLGLSMACAVGVVLFLMR